MQDMQFSTMRAILVLLLLLVGLPSTITASSTSLATSGTDAAHAHEPRSTVVNERDFKSSASTTVDLLKETWTFISDATIDNFQHQVEAVLKATTYVVKPAADFFAELFYSNGQDGSTVTSKDHAPSTSELGEEHKCCRLTLAPKQQYTKLSSVDGMERIVLNDLHRATQNSRRAEVKNRALRAINTRMAAQVASLRVELLNRTIDLLQEQHQQAALQRQLEFSEVLIDHLKRELAEYEGRTSLLRRDLDREKEAHEAVKQVLFLNLGMYEAALREIYHMQRTTNASVCISLEAWSQLVWNYTHYVSTLPIWFFGWLLYLMYHMVVRLRRFTGGQRAVLPTWQQPAVLAARVVPVPDPKCAEDEQGRDNESPLAQLQQPCVAVVSYVQDEGRNGLADSAPTAHDEADSTQAFIFTACASPTSTSPAAAESTQASVDTSYASPSSSSTSTSVLTLLELICFGPAEQRGQTGHGHGPSVQTLCEGGDKGKEQHELEAMAGTHRMHDAHELTDDHQQEAIFFAEEKRTSAHSSPCDQPEVIFSADERPTTDGHTEPSFHAEEDRAAPQNSRCDQPEPIFSTDKGLTTDGHTEPIFFVEEQHTTAQSNPEEEQEDGVEAAARMHRTAEQEPNDWSLPAFVVEPATLRSNGGGDQLQATFNAEEGSDTDEEEQGGASYSTAFFTAEQPTAEGHPEPTFVAEEGSNPGNEGQEGVGATGFFAQDEAPTSAQSDYLQFGDSVWEGDYRPGWYAADARCSLSPALHLDLMDTTGALTLTGPMSKFEEFMRTHWVLCAVKNAECPVIYEPPALILTCGEAPVWTFNGRIVATDEEVTSATIKAAYRQLMAKIHPDRHRGQWWCALAEEWTQEVTQLYRQLLHTQDLCTLYGKFKLEKERWEQAFVAQQAQEELERLKKQNEEREREINDLMQRMADRFHKTAADAAADAGADCFSGGVDGGQEDPAQRRKMRARRRRGTAGGGRERSQTS